MKRAKTLAAMLLTLALMLSAGLTSVFAQDSYDSISGDQSIPVKKTLDLKGAAYGPTHTVTFTVAEVGTINTTPVEHATGTMPTATVTFSGSDTEKETNLNFSTVNFPKPGIYKFTVTETDSHAAITPTATSETSYDLYLKVDNVVTATGESDLVPAGYKIVKGGKDRDVAANKVDEALFENEYTSYKLDVDKQVTGNQGDKTKEFTVTVKFEGATGVAVDDKYQVKWMAGTPKVGVSPIVDGTPVDVAANSTVTLKLKDTDKVEFYGIPAGITYTVTETDAGTDGYSTTYTGDTTHKFEDEDVNKAVTVVNDKQGTLPTGIFINNWPYITMVLVVIAAAVIFVSRRNRRLEDEDL